MLPYILQGVSFGFTAGVSPGSLMSYLLATTLSQGWRAAMVIIFAPLLSDLPIIIFTVFLLGSLGDPVQRLLQIVGGLFLLYLAWGTWQQARAGVILTAPEAITARPRDTLAKAVVMNLINPNPYIVWGTVLGPLLKDALALSAWHGLALIVSFYATFMSVMALQTLAFDRLGRIDPRFTRLALRLAVVILALFGLALLRAGLLG
ncbi:MAG: LysE family transporter [bacterium]|nr:LysE family transporter [bacterium]